MAAEPVSSLLMTADTVGGVWTYAVELARALSNAGVRVHLATMGGPVKDWQRRQVQAIPQLALHESEFALEWMRDPWRDVDAASDRLLELEQRHAPDLVHLNQFAFGASPLKAPKLVVAHSCVLSWWRAVHREPAPADWLDYATRVRAGLEGARLVAAPTLAMLSTLSQNYGFHGPHVVLPNARDAAQFQPAAKQPVIFSAGRFWDEAKNLTALEAVAESLEWPIRLAGSCIAPHGGMLKPRAVHPLGELDASTVAREMAVASIYAMPARYLASPGGVAPFLALTDTAALISGGLRGVVTK
jgi:hypothetical protein